MEQLTPGVHAVPRGRDHIQVGVGDHRTALHRTPETQAILDRLVSGPTTLPRGNEAARRLRAAGVVTEGPVPRGLARRLALESPRDWPARLERRAAAGVLVVGELVVDPRPLIDDCGFGGEPTTALVLARGAPDPADLDPLVRRGLPHVVVTAVDGVVTVGPFVQPGVTACCECVSLHHAADDPEHAEVQRRYRTAVRHDPDPPPPNRTLLTLAVAWAVRDLAVHVDGGQPTLWSSTIRLRPAGAPELTSWLRHPECGCGWTPTSR